MMPMDSKPTVELPFWKGLAYALIVTAAFATVITIWLYARPAGCQYCHPQVCFDSQVCGPGCVCAKTGSNPSGICAGILP